MRTSSIDAAALASLVFTVRQGKLVYFFGRICNVTPKYSLELLRSIEKALCTIMAIFIMGVTIIYTEANISPTGTYL